MAEHPMYIVLDTAVAPPIVVLHTLDEGEAHDVAALYALNNKRDPEQVLVSRFRPISRPVVRPA